jgi:hypothetical protein
VQQKQMVKDKADKFVDPTDAVYPPSIRSWWEVLEWYDPSMAQFACNISPDDCGYLFPEPAVFVQVQTTAHQEEYFNTWLKYCNVFIYQVGSQRHNAQAIPTSIWHDIVTWECVVDKTLPQEKQTYSSSM